MDRSKGNFVKYNYMIEFIFYNFKVNNKKDSGCIL